MEIRKAQEPDIDAILELNRQIGEIHYEHYPEVFCPPSPEERAFLLTAIAAEGRLFCVAELDGAVVGFLTARIDINESIPFLSKQPICRIGSVVVDEGHRSQGIGRALIAHCDHWARAHGAHQIRLEVMAFNEHAKALYETLGFKVQSQIMAR
ncbi:N-acetyltransferase [Aeromonas salmonicida]|uniref:GNAT family acetyltransferase n=1 Tax=Aeromonas salmonicida subsp. pectinolytica 34mel TaxID=1324960 RepID=T0PE82_AERSA|nr:MULTISPECIES: GNAT family N-acetyltransferase [Aeromonas]ATM00454.1 N-acetyltransferase [Aeromonas sp. CA23]ATP08998.1 GNAT family acetyltransferase [Aeromonas salmonicida subsp. pectinolytica 34mel]EQC02342.1 acetyltransferase [Aeromonas salmonicida subsp. pectinolytica 34mel]MCE9932146.1 GNAT family N-acetyltransferase [Aeromonas salmonicida]RSM27590.1 N-acetyltransferase [Aeromonas salmonicida]